MPGILHLATNLPILFILSIPSIRIQTILRILHGSNRFMTTFFLVLTILNITISEFSALRRCMLIWPSRPVPRPG